MPQVQFFGNIGPTRSQIQKEMLGESIGKGLSDFLNNYYANKALEGIERDSSYKNAPVSERASKLERALTPFGEVGISTLQRRIGIEQQREQELQKSKQEKIQSSLSKILSGEELTPEEKNILPPEIQFKAAEASKKRVLGDNIKKSLIKAGYPEETADLWKQQFEAAPTGGQTDVIKQANDLIRRSKTGKGIQETEEKVVSKPKIEIPGIESESFELDFPELPEPIGMTSADIVSQQKEREKTNVPLYSETVNRLNALDDEYREVTHLQELNEIPGALPTGLQKWNVDWDTGDLRVKALSTPEAQDYVKTIARMARRAKDFFPGRVTNFDLDQFKLGFPTLANSPEGRSLIAKQLALGNRIAFLKDEAMKAALEHYGSGSDPLLIQKYATDNYRKLKGKLEQQLKDVNKQADNYIKSHEKKSPVSIEQAKTLDDLFP